MSKDKAFEEFMFSEHGCDLHSKINCGDISAKRYAREVWQAATAESAARIAELEQKINALKVKAHESEMMAECTVMLRDDLIQAGIINETVPPMFMTEAILGHIRAITNTGDKT